MWGVVNRISFSSRYNCFYPVLASVGVFICTTRVSRQGNSSVIQTLSSICKMFLMTLISSWNNRSLRAGDWIVKRGSWPKIWIHRFLLNQGNHCPHHCHLLSAMRVGLDWSRFLIEEFMQGNSRFKAFKAGFVQHGIPGWWAYKLLWDLEMHNHGPSSRYVDKIFWLRLK